MTRPASVLGDGATKFETKIRLPTLGVSRAGYYRHWRASAPRQEETGVRDAVQRLAPADRHCGYRRIAIQLG
jgi:hypothetical protein